ncbi:hypothetical protein CYY_001034 [Polysphondylium violaceum]|uniref:NmrA-like domain-containing protein n=1 Tax=Polysphondylium violaceum TaxID=133409 RepID=A0A8J4Q2M7_9MYCE|nr:hypothetical protein CYY_001034 [Polysphondylium violaceum]
MSKKLISVFGATGHQGGSVVNALLEKRDDFSIRIFTRNTNSDKSKQLKNRGVDVVELDLEKVNTMAITKALEGSYGVFIVTDFWSLGNKEIQITKNIVDAAFNAHVKHLVYSSLAHVSKITNGRICSPEYDNKATVEEYVRERYNNAKNTAMAVSFVQCPFYAQNFHSDAFKPLRDNNGVYRLRMPLDPALKPLEIGDISNIGYIVLGIFSNPLKYNLVVVPFAGSTLHGKEIAEIMSKTSGKKVEYQFVPTSEYDPPSIADMFRFCSEYGAFNGLDTSLATDITRLTTLEEYLTNNPLDLL